MPKFAFRIAQSPAACKPEFYANGAAICAPFPTFRISSHLNNF